MYQRILVAMDKSTKESEGAIIIAKNFLAPTGEGILLEVIPPGAPLTVSIFTVPAFQVEQENCANAMVNLGFLADRLNQVSGRWRVKVAVSNSVAEMSVDLAIREKVDLIAMYAHDGNDTARLAKLIEDSLAEKAPRPAFIEVRVIKARELATA
ncbi:MAG: hypothetical protein BZY75_06280 [SAR202 cluster bacterium Io17-Chloro-G7]|nr:MAG: hypothetical protein BZY75_06280 [SAR202 cluster bacterium Io17-Chloro-G7]